jgi:hypothetical protein
MENGNYYLIILKLAETGEVVRRVFLSAGLMVAYKELSEYMGHDVVRSVAFIRKNGRTKQSMAFE